MALPKINVMSLAHVHYQHPDLDKAIAFFEDFGLVKALQTNETVYLCGSSPHPYLYIAERSPDNQRHFIGGYWVAESLQDLKTAASHPDASPIEEIEGPGGGQVVRLRDPHGFVLGIVHGQSLRSTEDSELRLELPDSVPISNYSTEKKRRGGARRFKHGPSPVYKLGHYGLTVPQAQYRDTIEWYSAVLNLKGTDAIFNPKTHDEVTCFVHIDRGAEYTDHHSFFAAASATAVKAHPHHCSFEVNDYDSQVLGHDWLRSKGWTNCWGIGRHVLGSQIFDYWFDASGNVVEHYSDGDLVNEDSAFEQHPAGPESLYVWGPNIPLSFMSGKLGDVGRTIVATPDVVEANPAQYANLPQPVALVTGGVSGIGLALTKHLLGRGYRVVIVDVNSKLGEQVQKELGPDTVFLQADISIYEQQAATFKRAFDWHQRLDFFAANAGIADTQNLYDLDEGEDDNGLVKPLNVKAMQVDLDSILQGIWIFKHYARKNPRRGGKIVITSSMAGLYAATVNPQYCTAKTALVGLTRCIGPVLLRVENITVNCICPGFIKTGLAPPAILSIFPKERMTPMSTAMKAYESFLNDDSLTGQVAELSGASVYYRQQVDYPDETMRWLSQDSGYIWRAGYKQPSESL
ncbi:hypothetical protein CLAIMM_08556 [Cladophialophora immunda]|nr:hypothetical protein CLAIMM_08556 [Cladophialophora immunda]